MPLSVLRANALRQAHGDQSLYPRPMAADPATPAADDPFDEERYGPLTLLRTRKDDGRSLILYSRERADDEASSGGEAARRA